MHLQYGSKTPIYLSVSNMVSKELLYPDPFDDIQRKPSLPLSYVSKCRVDVRSASSRRPSLLFFLSILLSTAQTHG